VKKYERIRLLTTRLFLSGQAVRGHLVVVILSSELGRECGNMCFLRDPEFSYPSV
jgi:hypothetical protein